MLQRYLYFIAIFSFISCAAITEKQNDFSIASTFTGDTYDINILKPQDYSGNKNYHLIFVADGAIGLGEYLLGTNPKWKAEVPANCIIIAISHRGNWKTKRARDFIPSDAGGEKNEDFGNADKYYSFLKSELMPRINSMFKNVGNKIFLGHSFSGLFALYSALQNENLFDHYYAISPSVWANYNKLLKIEEAIADKGIDLKANIDIIVGGLEVFNKVISSSKEFKDAITSRGYSNLVLNYEVIGGANHYSVRKPAVDRILKKVEQQ